MDMHNTAVFTIYCIYTLAVSYLEYGGSQGMFLVVVDEDDLVPVVEAQQCDNCQRDLRVVRDSTGECGVESLV